MAQYFDRLKGITTGVTMSGSGQLHFWAFVKFKYFLRGRVILKGIGSFSMAPFATFLLAKYNWDVTMIVLGSMLMQCCIMGALLRPVPTRIKSIEMEDKGHQLRPSNANVSTFQSNKDLNILSFTGSIVSVGNFNMALNIGENSDDPEIPWYKRAWAITVAIAKEISDLKLLTQNMSFLLITLSNFFVFLGYFIPFIYIPLVAKDLIKENPALESDLSENRVAFIFSIIGKFKI